MNIFDATGIIFERLKKQNPDFKVTHDLNKVDNNVIVVEIDDRQFKLRVES